MWSRAAVRSPPRSGRPPTPVRQRPNNERATLRLSCRAQPPRRRAASSRQRLATRHPSPEGHHRPSPPKSHTPPLAAPTRTLPTTRPSVTLFRFGELREVGAGVGGRFGGQRLRSERGL